MWRRVLIACALLLAVPLATVLWLVYTESGLRFVVAQLDRLQTMQIKVEGLSGTIAGPLRLQRFELDHERVHIIVHDVVADFRIRGLLLLTGIVLIRWIWRTIRARSASSSARTP